MTYLLGLKSCPRALLPLIQKGSMELKEHKRLAKLHAIPMGKLSGKPVHAFWMWMAQNAWKRVPDSPDLTGKPFGEATPISRIDWLSAQSTSDVMEEG